ncbi:MAG: tRNA 2-thiouridine(34) synthase MnmA [Candidatus Dojkabacteria bacterium]|nr:tRNA 2-thiouridine(34) synthase MnmA [Candidatus Dojkabacteria bacterium]
MKRKVFVGFSGGVDSSVSAYLLKRKYDVTAVMFRNLSNPDCYTSLEENAKKVAEHIGIPFKVVDLSNEFQNLIIDPFINSYKNGATPNPCVLCNIQFKFDRFANWCFENGADFIATGHYCKTKNSHLYKGKDEKKDQSYFLSGISSQVLEKTIFPIGNFTKEKVRNIAKRKALPNQSQRDSQEVCFINTNLNDFLNTNIEQREGNVVDIGTNKVVGKHSGIHSLTLGQRKGIHIGGSNEPYFVAKKDIDKNIIYVAKGKLNPSLWKQKFELENINIINQKNNGIIKGLTAKVRYRATEIPCTIDWNTNNVELKEKVWTPSVGQQLVIYKGNECIGGGMIKNIGQ